MHQPIKWPNAELTTGDWAVSTHEDLPFALYGSKELSGAKKYPLLLALHGKSDNNENGKQVGGWIKTFAKELERNEDLKYTELPDGGHGIIGRVFNDLEVHKWLFAQGVEN